MMDLTSETSEHRLSCSCGSIKLLVAGKPIARAYCHCASCRDFYSLPVLAATAWKTDAIVVATGQEVLGVYQHPTKQLRRHFCTNCGEAMFGVNRLGLTVIQTALFAKAAGGALPNELSPEFHLFYAQRELDMGDELPKYLEGRGGALLSVA
jgi:hypothetical protein